MLAEVEFQVVFGSGVGQFEVEFFQDQTLGFDYFIDVGSPFLEGRRVDLFVLHSNEKAGFSEPYHFILCHGYK